MAKTKKRVISIYERNAMFWDFISISLFFVAGMNIWFNPVFAFVFVMVGLFCHKLYEINLKFDIKNEEVNKR